MSLETLCLHGLGVGAYLKNRSQRIVCNGKLSKFKLPEIWSS